MPIVQPGIPSSVGSWRTAEGSADPAVMRERILFPTAPAVSGSALIAGQGVIAPYGPQVTQGSALIAGIGRVSPAGPALTGWRANEPAGWTTSVDADMNYTGVTTTTEPFFSVNGSPYSGQYPTVQAELFTEGSINFLDDATEPVSSPDFVRFPYPEGLGDGQRGAFFDGGINNEAGGVYYAYSMRLSPNWAQGGAGNEAGNGVKHIEIRTTGGPVVRTNIGREVGTGDNQYGMRLGNILVSGQIPRTNIEATRFAPGEWITVEALFRYNTAGAGTGQMSLWVNEILAAQDLANDLPKPGNHSIIRILNIFGGGIGAVPADQYIDIGHLYASGG